MASDAYDVACFPGNWDVVGDLASLFWIDENDPSCGMSLAVMSVPPMKYILDTQV